MRIAHKSQTVVGHLCLLYHIVSHYGIRYVELLAVINLALNAYYGIRIIFLRRLVYQQHHYT